MDSNFLVELSFEPAAEPWNKDTLISYAAHGATIHLPQLEDVRRMQKAGRQLASQCVNQIHLSGENWNTELQWAFHQGYVTPGNTLPLLWAVNDQTDIERLEAKAQSAAWTRSLINASADEIYPESLAQQVAAYFGELAPESISYELIQGDQLLEQEWAGLHAVGRGSERAPVMLILDYNPTGHDDAPVSAALVGKGITFDSGGYSIKGSEGMLAMKCDMGGAATVAGGLALAIESGLSKRVKLILCCAENLISGHAYKLGDVIRYKNGTTVEIVNTDAEGRLVLADGLMAAAETGAPLILDAATLTGAAMVAVGTEYNALFGLDQALVQRVQQYATAEHEPSWPLPLEAWHQENCPSAYADTANSRPQKGGGFGGASNAAGFLSRFVPNEGKGWVHIDLAACFQTSGNGQWAAGATAVGIRTIARTLLEETA
ncbi:aminopeptidase PepB [Algicola sagamiensis]|uniref:aminopeptidase PepB n=1 Tax=Algicola sagamiensis TaxID=163869 RepID=UPI00037F2608|nr:aminopeptidase PepB [Algicola sagamiensis]